MSSDNNKLYRVILRGMTGTLGTSVAYGAPYVVATSPDAAVALVRAHLEENDIGFSGDRELKSVELLAESTAYPDCRIQLFGVGYIDE